MARTLNTTVMVGAKIYEAGTPESQIDGTITAQGVWDGEVDTTQTTSTGYANQGVDELKAEAEKRELDVEGTGANGNVLKDDLVQALEADDLAKA